MGVNSHIGYKNNSLSGEKQVIYLEIIMLLCWENSKDKDDIACPLLASVV